MKAIFLHGMLSTPSTSASARAVKEFLTRKGVEVIIPDYKPQTRSYDEINAFLTKEVKACVDTEDEVMLIGISLGGYWAFKMANDFKRVCHCVLINPALNYYGKPVHDNQDVPLTIIVNADDDVVDNRETMEKFKKRGYCVEFPTGGHRPTNMNQILPLIEEALYTLIL
jgi:predicted esterase YcpF (UPF0227 family)